MNKTKFLAGIFALALLFSIGFACAKDVVYLVAQSIDVRPDIASSMDELGLSYDIVTNSQISAVNFDDYRMIVVNDNDFEANWDKIPVNNKSSLILSWQHIGEWGWASYVSTLGADDYIPVILNSTFSINEGLNATINSYDSIVPDIHYLERTALFRGVELAATDKYNQGAVVAVVANGTNLTKGTKKTIIKANSIFFGITDSAHWTPDAEQLFKNCLIYLADIHEAIPSFNISIQTGNNLVSFPLAINITPSQMMSENPQIMSIKEWNGNSFVNATSLQNNKGYFIESSSSFVLVISGRAITAGQNVALASGLNLIGAASLNNIPLSTLPGGIIEASRRNAGGTYDIATKYPSGWYNSFNLEPGRGYWFKANSAVNWAYTP